MKNPPPSTGQHNGDPLLFGWLHAMSDDPTGKSLRIRVCCPECDTIHTHGWEASWPADVVCGKTSHCEAGTDCGNRRVHYFVTLDPERSALHERILERARTLTAAFAA